VVYFWNAIAEQVVKVHPNKLLVVDAYSVYAGPPVERKLHPNLVVRFASLGYADEDYRQESLRDWDQWSKAAKKIYFRPNLMLAGRRDGMPLLYVHKFGKDFRYLADHGMIGTDFDSCCHNWATQGLNYYVVARLHWNPEQDVDALVDDYCRAGFGPAAKPVRRYFDGLEGLMNEVAAKKTKATAAFTAEALAGLRKELNQARKDAGSDAIIAKRIDFLELGLRWTVVETKAHALLADPKADKEAAKRTLDERFALMREVFQKTPLALNVAYISWGEDALWLRIVVSSSHIERQSRGVAFYERGNVTSDSVASESVPQTHATRPPSFSAGTNAQDLLRPLDSSIGQTPASVAFSLTIRCSTAPLPRSSARKSLAFSSLSALPFGIARRSSALYLQTPRHSIRTVPSSVGTGSNSRLGACGPRLFFVWQRTRRSWSSGDLATSSAERMAATIPMLPLPR
jgi:hypothetical protein